ncbi:glycine-rich cell wall structural protein 1.8-like [Lycium barbarum]|uniref:glycine-rich cell wall structural protein 1.8-like n=1 Tax=Lycium barbarum TaxID=112863 RepID=UPI00293E0816|nr:glycine-rich cell wall structural protein 1.8-like [Lycium barbarum]
MGLQTDMYPSHGFKQQQQQSYYNDNDYYSSDDNYYSNNSSSMQMKKPYGYPSVTTPQHANTQMMMSSHGGYSHSEDKYQNGHGQYGQHMSHDSANMPNSSSSMFHANNGGGYGSGMQQYSSHANGGYGGYGNGMQQSSHMTGGYGNEKQQHSFHMAGGGYGSGMQHSSHMAGGGYGSGMQHSSHMAGGGYGGMQHSASHTHMSKGLERDSDRSPGYYEQHNKNTDMWNLRSLDD